MEKKLFTRKDYKRLKKMDRVEMENFIKSIYRTGYADGAAAEAEASREIDIAQALLNTKGVGEVLYKRIMEEVKKVGRNEQNY